MKTVGIILGTFVATIGLIISIVLFNFHYVKDQPVVVKFPKSNVHITVPEEKDKVTVFTNIKSLECEVVDLANKKFKYNQIICEGGRKDGFRDQELLDQKGHQKVKIGDTVIATFDDDGVVNVRLVNK
ncbi:hypothetical protein ACFCYN_20585 [Gottfriedia sp. NPDC056225]|uniref:hypothetical protein n=1 Tax=Gottfriedia sp. NPDC056225 TaxID=3345751 RepID=UPI0035D66F7E